MMTTCKINCKIIRVNECDIPPHRIWYCVEKIADDDYIIETRCSNDEFLEGYLYHSYALSSTATKFNGKNEYFKTIGLKIPDILKLHTKFGSYHKALNFLAF